MKTVGAFAAKTHLSQLLDEVEQGQRITITRRGVPIAVLAPANGARQHKTPAEAVAAIRAFQERTKLSLGGMSIREAIDEGRRF